MMAYLKGTQTPRGVGITRTVSCEMRAAHNPALGGGPVLEIPNPFPLSRPGVRLLKRQAMYVKYFDISHASAGTFYLVEQPVSPVAVAVARGYPLTKVIGQETRRQKRLKQVVLPMTGSIRLYSGVASVEFGSSLEFG